jgi:hypothetical protein
MSIDEILLYYQNGWQLGTNLGFYYTWIMPITFEDGIM